MSNGFDTTYILVQDEVLPLCAYMDFCDDYGTHICFKCKHLQRNSYFEPIKPIVKERLK